ncbi:unnamed protein product [Fraxinus pennsylvanica]|uniref:Strictosidine synthase conserved region domain-containing protein n=1 Tax=Fraxinus pennsylvanica TaxID=56036 RepID=A0AAD1Z838_9LAMI|nr:unnamed protein product [Fraxinus pennsylvanica]
MEVKTRCSRRLGLRFDRKSGDLYIADSYYGLLVVGPEGGLASPLATRVDRKPTLFTNDLDIHNNGSIFFADTSKNKLGEFIHNPWLRSINFQMPIPMRYLARLVGLRMYSMVPLLNDKGDILDVLEDKKGLVLKLVCEVKEANGKL